MRLKIAAAVLLALLLSAVLAGTSAFREAEETSPLVLPDPTIETLAADRGIPEVLLSHDTLAPETAQPPEPEIHTITLSFVGDCMLASYMGNYGTNSFNRFADGAEPSHFFAGVYDIFSADDFTIANCENVFTDSELTEAEKDHSPAYWYRSKTKNAAIFAAGSVELVSVSNNHTMDYGEQGAADTKAALDAAGVIWGDSSHPVIVEKYGVRIAVYMTGMWGEYRTTALSKKIRELEEVSDYQIIYYHGGTEREYTPEEWRVRASRKLTEAGADLVVGNHPHVLQPMETYNGSDILYSLGNFLFGGSSKDDKFTVIYQKLLTVCEGKIIAEDFRLIPVYEYEGSKNTAWQPFPMTEGSQDYESVLAFMRGEVSTPRG